MSRPAGWVARRRAASTTIRERRLFQPVDPASPGSEHPAFLRAVTAGLRPYALLATLCLALFVPGIAAIPAFDQDESRFAQASHQMLESGDYVTIHFQDSLRAKKPAGVYWLQAAAARLTGAERAIWPYRIPSVLGATLAVLLTFHFGRRLVGRPAALVGAALLASSFVLVWEAHFARADAVLLATAVAAQGVLGRFYVTAARGKPRPGLGLALVFWLAQAAALLVKGPVVPMISLLTVAALGIVDRNVRWLAGLRPLPGLIVMAAVAGPWYWAVSRATGGAFLGQAVKTDLLAKILGGQESHGAPPTYYLVLLILTFWPGSLFVIPALWRAAKHRQEAATRFCLAWIVPSWLVFEAVPTKLPTYVLPLFPPLALLAGILVVKKASENRAWVHQYALVWSLIGMGIGIFIMITPVRLATNYPWWFSEIALLALACGLLPAKAIRVGRPRLALALLLSGAVLLFAGLFQCVLPRLDKMWITRSIAAAIPAGAPVAAAGYHPASVVFSLGTGTLLTDGPGAAQFLARTPNGYAITDERTDAAFEKALRQIGFAAKPLARIDGFDYTHGKSTLVTVWESDK